MTRTELVAQIIGANQGTNAAVVSAMVDDVIGLGKVLNMPTNVISRTIKRSAVFKKTTELFEDALTSTIIDSDLTDEELQEILTHKQTTAGKKFDAVRTKLAGVTENVLYPLLNLTTKQLSRIMYVRLLALMLAAGIKLRPDLSVNELITVIKDELKTNTIVPICPSEAAEKDIEVLRQELSKIVPATNSAYDETRASLQNTMSKVPPGIDLSKTVLIKSRPPCGGVLR